MYAYMFVFSICRNLYDKFIYMYMYAYIHLIQGAPGTLGKDYKGVSAETLPRNSNVFWN